MINTSRGVKDALNWLEYYMGDATTEYGKMRVANGHPAPYQLHSLEIDNEPWLMMRYPAYLDIVKRFCPAIRAQYPDLKLSVAGGYGYDTGPGEGDLIPKTATMQLVAPGGETVKNSLDEPDNIKVVSAAATIEDHTVTFTMPPLSAGVVRVTP